MKRDVKALAILSTQVKNVPEIEGYMGIEDVRSICRYYENIIGVMPNNVYWLDRNCITQGCNENVLKLIGLKKMEEFIGITYEEMGRLAGWTEGQAESFKTDDMEVMASGVAKINIEEPLLYDRTGKSVYYMSSRVPLFNDDKEVIGVVGISVNITERKKQELALQEAKEKAESASRSKSEFITNMSHDIRTPLAGIVSIAGRLSEKAKNPEEKEQLELMEDGAKQLLALLNNVLEIASAEGESEELLKDEVFNLHDSIKNISALILPNIKAKNLSLITHIDKNIPEYVVGSQVRFERILLNLLGNAIKFTEKGSITFQGKILSEENKKYDIEWSIADTGIGIPQEEQSKVFDRFFRASPSYKGLYKGNGVGLYIAQKFVQQLGGKRIQVESEVGKGTRFYFVLPMKKIDAPIVNHELDVSVDWMPRQESYKVLLVEDTKIARIAAKFLLQELNCELDYADDGETALRKATDNTYELIFMDIGLPDISGTEVTEMVRKQEMAIQRHTPIIGLSAHIDKKIRQQAYEAGMDEVLIKPLLKDQAKAALAKFCDTHSGGGQKKEKTTSIETDEIFNSHLFTSKFPDEKMQRELLQSFLDDTLSEEAIPLASAYAKMDWVALEKIAHSIKGAALAVDAIKLSQVSEQLVACCRCDCQDNVSNLYYDLLQTMDATKIAIKNFLL